MLPVYSQLFHAVHSFIGVSNFEIPAGQRAIVRDIDLVVGISAGITLIAADGSRNQFWGLTTDVVGAGKRTYSWRGRQVIDGPGFFTIDVDAECDFRSSGYLLSLP